MFTIVYHSLPYSLPMFTIVYHSLPYSLPMFTIVYHVSVLWFTKFIIYLELHYCLPGLLPTDVSAPAGFPHRKLDPWPGQVLTGKPCYRFSGHWKKHVILVISIGCIHGIYIYMAYMIVYAYIIYGKGKWGLTPWVTTIWMEKWQSVPQNGMV